MCLSNRKYQEAYDRYKYTVKLLENRFILNKNNIKVNTQLNCNTQIDNNTIDSEELNIDN